MKYFDVEILGNFKMLLRQFGTTWNICGCIGIIFEKLGF